jgi:succinate-semialdehyde dehydrogenase/glutarate-semialdehyde dehydrogenase
LKPAHDTPLTALAIADILQRAGLPEGVVNVVVADPPGPAVEAMLDSGKIRKLSFTGSTRVGSLLLAQAAKRIINCSMELGGNAPFIVFDDADIDLAVEGALLAKMRNGGAACTAANRFYIHNSVLAEFTDKFTARMSALTLGDGLDPTTTLGPLVSRAQQERVATAVSTAVSRGAKVLCGGTTSSTPAFGYEATVLADVSPTDEILQDEIFGPVASLVSFSDDTEMMRQANDVEHGLVSYVFTRDAARGMRTAELLETGMVGFNRGLVSDPAAPFGGVKASGIGREGGHDGLLAFLETKYVAGNW